MDSLSNFIDENLLILIYFLPIITQLGIPLGISIYIVYLGSTFENLYALFFFIFKLSIVFLIGDVIAYFIGRNLGINFLNKIEKKFNLKKVIDKSLELVKKNLIFSVFFTRTIFLAGAPILNYIIGIEKVSFRFFLILVFISEILYVTIFASLGFILKDLWPLVSLFLEDISIIVVIIIIIYFITLEIYKYFKK